MIRHCFILFLLFIVILGCKKYPKNKFPIILQPPEMTLKKLNGAKLKYFKINGADSTWVIEKRYPDAREREFEYDPGTCYHKCGEYASATYRWNTSTSITYVFGNTTFSNNKKKIYFHGAPFGFAKNDWWWDILKLTGNELILQSKFNNIEYEMAFGK